MKTGDEMLKEWRATSGMSQALCAAKVGAVQSAWNTWEKGVRSPQVHFAIKIAELTGGAVPVSSWVKADRESGPLPVDDGGATGTDG